MAISKAASRRKRRDSLRHKSLYMERVRRKREHDARKYRRGDVPLCMERVPGLWWIEGMDGYYRRATGAFGHEAFDANRKLIVLLAPVSPEDAADEILLHAECEAMWQFLSKPH